MMYEPFWHVGARGNKHTCCSRFQLLGGVVDDKIQYDIKGLLDGAGASKR